MQALGDGIADAAVAWRYEAASRRRRNRPHARYMATVGRAGRAGAGKFAKDPTIGEIAVACALGYLDFRLPDLDWQRPAPNCGWYAQFCEYPSMKATVRSRMKINGKHYRSVWPIGEDAFGIIDQTKLPHEFVTLTLRSADDAAHAIKTMQTRGAPLIGAVGGLWPGAGGARRCLRRNSRRARTTCWPRRGPPRSICTGR